MIDGLSSLYEVKDGVRVRVERKRDGKEYRYYLVKMPDVWIKKIARDLNIRPEELEVKMCFNEIGGLLVMPIKPKNIKPKPVENAELVERLEK